MKKVAFYIFVAVAVFNLKPALSGEPINIRNLTLVDENRAVLSKDGIDYQLDSYIIPFKQPYYIHIKRKDGKEISKEEAVKISTEYIQPRGCTEPLKRLEKLDKNNSDKTEWVIGVAC